MTKVAYDSINTAIDDRQPLALRVHTSTIRITPVSRRGKEMIRLTWGLRGHLQRQEFSEPRRAKEYAQAILVSAQLGKLAPTPQGVSELDRALQVMALVPGVPPEKLVETYLKQQKEAGRYVNALVTEYIQASIANKKSNRHIQTLRHHLVKFGQTFRMPISHVTTANLVSYLDRIPNPKTRNNHRISIISLFQHAKRAGDLPYDVASSAERTQAAKVVRSEPLLLPLPALKKLLEDSETDQKLKMFLLLGAFAGCRSAEILRLRWRHITSEGIFLTPETTKTSRRRVVEIEDNLAAWLKTVGRGEDNDRVSFTYESDLYENLRARCKAQGVEWIDNGLRHGYASCHLEKYRDPVRTSKNTGHSLRELETTYLRLLPKSSADAWFALLPPEPEETQIEKHGKQTP